MAVRFNPMDPEFLEDPYPTYARLRAEAPIHRVRFNPLMAARMTLRFTRSMMKDSKQGIFGALRGLNVARKQMRSQGRGARGRFYVLARHADVVHALRHAELFSSKAMGGGPQPTEGGQMSPTSGSLISVDPPEHREHRGVVNRGFTPRRIEALEPQIRKLADELVSSFEQRGECDLIDAFANPLPVGTIVELLGLDPGRRGDFKRWTNALIIGGTQPDATPPFQVIREFREYMSGEVEKRRQEPSDDMISLLVSSQDEGVLDTDQVIGFASLLLAAGSETTTNLIGNAMVRLREQPETLERVKADPSLIPRVLDESLRIDPPVQLLMRLATEDTEIGGVPIPKDSMVMPLLASANRDESVFPDATRFDIDRDTSGHVGFGWGNHFCLGSALAKLEGKIALETLLERIPDYEIASPVEMHGSFLIRGPKALQLRWSVRH
jgi:cytochrome P450